MLILGLQSPEGETTYIAAAFPSACGKTNLAMLTPPAEFKGWKVFTVGDDISWMRVGPDGGLWAVNPENGYFGVAPGTSTKSNLNAMKMVEHDTIFTNVAMTAGRRRVVGRDGRAGARRPARLAGATVEARTRKTRRRIRTAASRRRCATIRRWSPSADDPRGVPISAIIFGGRRATTVPLVLESMDWAHGVFMGATMGSETTAAASGAVGVLRRDPMAMLPFCGYNMGDYFAHWLKMRAAIKKPPRIFMVNWFRKGADGNFIWPGYGENMRVLRWMLDRIHGRAKGRATPVGIVPDEAELDLKGLDLSKSAAREALAVNPAEWKAELESAAEFFEKIGSTMPKELKERREAILKSLSGEGPAQRVASAR